MILFCPAHSGSVDDSSNNSTDTSVISPGLSVGQSQALTLNLPGGNFSGTESILSTASSGFDQDSSAIWNERVVWVSIYADSVDPQIHFSDIFLYNISTGESTRIGTNLSALATPDVWEDLIVWSTWEDGNFEIFLYDISTSETSRITNDSVNQLKPRIWGDHIVWQEGGETDPAMAVYLYTISTGAILQLDAGSGYALSPAIWEDRVVWQDGRNGNDFDIFLYNCTTGTETQITVDPAWQTNPDIWGDNIVWEDPRESFPHIYMYDLGSLTETKITVGETNHGTPKIYENYVVYLNESDIYTFDLSSMNEARVSSDDSATSRSNPDIWDNRITWTDGRNGDKDIYLFTIGIEVPPLVADFTVNITQGEFPLTVAFTDTSSGQIEGWHWDFGDGNSSVEQNPVHTYVFPGSYSVILNIHNQRQRDGILKGDLISVGSVPVPQFSVNQTSGPAPLAVWFTDESSGLPTEWKWEFGDGGSSGEQNPSYIYQKAGVFNVSLVVSNVYGNATIMKQQLISIMDGTYQTCLLPSEGIEINNTGSGPILHINTSSSGNCSFDPVINPGLISSIPDIASGIAQISFLSQEGTEFSYLDSETITGLLDRVSVTSCDVVPKNFSHNVGNTSRFNFSVSMPTYPERAAIQVVTWEGATPDNMKEFNHICSDYGYSMVEDLAYTAGFNKENMPDNESATLIFGVSPDWVEKYGWRWSHQIVSDPPGAGVYVDSKFVGTAPLTIGEGLSPGSHTITIVKTGYYSNITTITMDDKRDAIHVIRIGDDGTGEILNTTFIGYDPVHNLDLFRAESPNGLSTFGVASLSRSGSIPQLIQMIATRALAPSGGGGGGGGDNGGSAAPKSATTTSVTSVPTPRATSQATALPTQIHSTPPEIQPTSVIQPGVTASPGETGTQPAPGQESPSWIGIFPTAISSFSIVFVVIFVTIVFYYRWKRKEE
jgi:beta propeller repeat protein